MSLWRTNLRQLLMMKSLKSAVLSGVADWSGSTQLVFLIFLGYQTLSCPWKGSPWLSYHSRRKERTTCGYISIILICFWRVNGPKSRKKFLFNLRTSAIPKQKFDVWYGPMIFSTSNEARKKSNFQQSLKRESGSVHLYVRRWGHSSNSLISSNSWSALVT